MHIFVMIFRDMYKIHYVKQCVWGENTSSRVAMRVYSIKSFTRNDCVADAEQALAPVAGSSMHGW